MPELPEVECILNSLRLLLKGRVLAAFEVFDATALASPAAAFEELVGRRLERLERRGKYLLWCFEHNRLLVVHLRMTGGFALVEPDEAAHPHHRLRLTFEGLPQKLVFRDYRRFGRFLLAPEGDTARVPGLKDLGPEPLGMSPGDLAKRLGQRKIGAKAALLRQDLVAGLGNIYVDETLFRAGVHPRQDLSRLDEAAWTRLHGVMRAVLQEAITCGGTTIINFQGVHGGAGEFREHLQVYGRAGRPCVQCGHTVHKEKIAGRGTHFCPNCQQLQR
jgi:formamidopyrimidine-DNA glycosylase